MADLRKQQVEAQGGAEEDAKGTREATIPAAPPTSALPPYAPSMWSAHRKTLLLQSKQQQAARTGSGSGRACGGGRGSGICDGHGGCGGGGNALHAAAIRVMTYRALRDAPVCSLHLN